MSVLVQRETRTCLFFPRCRIGPDELPCSTEEPPRWRHSVVPPPPFCGQSGKPRCGRIEGPENEGAAMGAKRRRLPRNSRRRERGKRTRECGQRGEWSPQFQAHPTVISHRRWPLREGAPGVFEEIGRLTVENDGLKKSSADSVGTRKAEGSKRNRRRGRSVPSPDSGLVQPIRAGLGVVEQAGIGVLCGGVELHACGTRSVWSFEHGPGRAVHERGAHRGFEEGRRADQHGWSGPCARPYRHRAAVAEREGRGVNARGGGNVTQDQGPIVRTRCTRSWRAVFSGVGRKS